MMDELTCSVNGIHYDASSYHDDDLKQTCNRLNPAERLYIVRTFQLCGSEL